MEWISTKDAIPEENSDILAVGSFNGIYLIRNTQICQKSSRRLKRGTYCDVFACGIGINTWIGIKYWMPIPEVPKQEEVL